MGRVEILAVLLAAALNAIDGFDVLAITFAAPGIAKAWGIGPAQLGVALSSGLAGMTLGSLLLGPFGDRYGRRPLILACLLLMSVGMGLTATASGIVSLCAWRIVTGLGIGGMLAAINAVAAEFASERRRDLCVGLMTIGYPVGGLIGGFVVADYIVPRGWQVVFVAGALATAVFLPLVWLGLPESRDFIARGRESAQRGAPRGNTAALFAPRFRRRTLVLVSAYFLHMLTFYFFSGWLPKLMSDLGHTIPDAVRTSALLSLGGIIGGAVFGWLAPRVGLVRLLAIAMAGTCVGLMLFGNASALASMRVFAFATGVAMFGGIVGLYSLLARSFPAELRVTGTGLAIGLGRGGSILGPIVGGVLIAQGVSASSAIAVVGVAALGAAVIVLLGQDRKFGEDRVGMETGA